MLDNEFKRMTINTVKKFCCTHRLAPCSVIIREASSSNRWDQIQRLTARSRQREIDLEELSPKLDVSIKCSPKSFLHHWSRNYAGTALETFFLLSCFRSSRRCYVYGVNHMSYNNKLKGQNIRLPPKTCIFAHILLRVSLDTLIFQGRMNNIEIHTG